MNYIKSKKILSESVVLNEGWMQWILGIIAMVGGVSAAYKYRNQIESYINGMKPGLGTMIKTFLETIGNPVRNAAEKGIEKGSAAGNLALSYAQPATDAVKGAASNVADKGKNFWDHMTQPPEEVFKQRDAGTEKLFGENVNMNLIKSLNNILSEAPTPTPQPIPQPQVRPMRPVIFPNGTPPMPIQKGVPGNAMNPKPPTGINPAAGPGESDAHTMNNNATPKRGKSKPAILIKAKFNKGN